MYPFNSIWFWIWLIITLIILIGIWFIPNKYIIYFWILLILGFLSLIIGIIFFVYRSINQTTGFYVYPKTGSIYQPSKIYVSGDPSSELYVHTQTGDYKIEYHSGRWWAEYSSIDTPLEVRQVIGELNKRKTD